MFRSERIKRNRPQLRKALFYGRQGIWNVVEYVFYPLLMLATTPVFLQSLGAKQYGQWMFLISLGSLGGWAGMGMGAATIREVAAAHGRGDQRQASQYVGAATLIVILGSLAVGFILICGFLSGGSQLFVLIGSRSELFPIVVGAALLIATDQIDSVLSGSLRGLDCFGLAARLEMISKLVIVTGWLVTAVTTQRLELLIIYGIALNLLRVVIKASAVANLFGIEAILPYWHSEAAVKLIKFGKWSTVQLIGSALFSSADRLIIGTLLGANTLANYSICLQLAQQVQSIPASLGGILFPYFAKRTQRSDISNQSGVLAISSTVISLTAICIALPLAIFAYPILNLWVGAAVASESYKLLITLVLSYVILALSVPAHYLFYGSGQVKIVAFSNLGAGVLSMLLNFALIPYLGAFGAAFSRMFYGAIILLIYCWRLLR